MPKERGPLSACNPPCAILSDKSDGSDKSDKSDGANNSRWLPGRSGKLGDTLSGSWYRGWSLYIGHRFADDRCLRKEHPKGAIPRALSCRTSRTGRTSRTVQITPGGYLEGQASSATPGRGCGCAADRPPTKQWPMPMEIAPLPGCNPQPGIARLLIPEGRSPERVRLSACRSRRDHPALRNSNVTRA